MTKNFTLKEVASLLGVSIRQLYRWRSRGLLKITYLAESKRLPRVTEENLNKFLSLRGEKKR